MDRKVLIQQYQANFDTFYQHHQIVIDRAEKSAREKPLDPEALNFDFETQRSALYSFLENPERHSTQMQLEVLKEKGDEAKDYILNHLHAAEIIKEENLFGPITTVAADLDRQMLIKEPVRFESEVNDPTVKIDEFVQSHDVDEIRLRDLLDLMLYLDKLISLDIEPHIDTANLCYQDEVGFTLNDYAYKEGLQASLETSSKEHVLELLRNKLLPLLAKKSQSITAKFNSAAELFLSQPDPSYTKNYDSLAKEFEPALNSLIKKIDHNKSDGAPRFKANLSQAEQEAIIDNGGECLVISNQAKDKVAKIYFKGNAGMSIEREALKIAHETGVTNIATVLGCKDNVLIESMCPGKPIPEYDTSIFEDTNFQKIFKEQLRQLLRDYKTLSEAGVMVDLMPSNVLYDKRRGFFFIDLNLIASDGFDSDFNFESSSKHLIDVLGRGTQKPLFREVRKEFISDN